MRVLVKDRQLVIPGQLIAKGRVEDDYCLNEEGGVYSLVMGMVRVDEGGLRVIPATGTYVPREGDVVIGIVKNIQLGKWVVDIASPYACVLLGQEVVRDYLTEDLSKYFGIGDIISARVAKVNEVFACQLTKPLKLRGGLVVDIDPKRTPRVIGRRMSMLNLIKEKTGCKIVVGQNGRIWIKVLDKEPELREKKTSLIVQVIKKIEREAQSTGLTERIAQLLDAELGEWAREA